MYKKIWSHSLRSLREVGQRSMSTWTRAPHLEHDEGGEHRAIASKISRSEMPESRHKQQLIMKCFSTGWLFWVTESVFRVALRLNFEDYRHLDSRKNMSKDKWWGSRSWRQFKSVAREHDPSCLDGIKTNVGFVVFDHRERKLILRFSKYSKNISGSHHDTQSITYVQHKKKLLEYKNYTVVCFDIQWLDKPSFLSRPGLVAALFYDVKWYKRKD